MDVNEQVRLMVVAAVKNDKLLEKVCNDISDAINRGANDDCIRPFLHMQSQNYSRSFVWILSAMSRKPSYDVSEIEKFLDSEDSWTVELSKQVLSRYGR